jgi:hypothetical protein
LVVEESSAGNTEAVEQRLSFLRGIRELPVDDEVKTLATALLTEGGVPPKSEMDALHIAIATVNGMNYLLTWNCRHLNNPVTKPRVREICRRLGYMCPEICTPLELTEAQSDER